MQCRSATSALLILICVQTQTRQLSSVIGVRRGQVALNHLIPPLLDPQPPQSKAIKYGNSITQSKEPVSTLKGQRGTGADNTPSLFLDRACGGSLQFRSTAHFGQHTDITFQDVPKPVYTLRLFVENEEIRLQRNDNRTWTPAQRLYGPCFPTMYTC
jgi:hypothetical protein